MSAEFTITAEMLAAHAEWRRTRYEEVKTGVRIVCPPGAIVVFAAGLAWSSADLRGANLRGADLLGTATGHVGRYDWQTWREGDTRWLRFGCESHKIADWPALCEPLAWKNEPDRAQFYERATLALVALCVALDEPEAGK